MTDKTPWTSPPPPATPLRANVETEPMRVLKECVELMERKAHDYQNPNSEVKQAMYYPNGLLTLNDIIWAKWLRIKSLIEAQKNGETPKNESLEDSYKDMINYCSFAVGWIRGKIDGQEPGRDILNKPKLPSFANTTVSGPAMPMPTPGVIPPGYFLNSNGHYQTCGEAQNKPHKMTGGSRSSFSYDHLDEEDGSSWGNKEDNSGC